MMYALAIVGAILIFALLTKWWHDAYWLGMSRNIEIPTLNTLVGSAVETDSYAEFMQEVTRELEQNDGFWKSS